jgi:hypothetical protein
VRRPNWPPLLTGPRVRRLYGVSLALIVFLWSWVFLGHWFFERNARSVTQNHDALLYDRYGAAMRKGQLPYRDFSVVYPPGALAAFVAPTYVVSANDVSGYRKWFARLMAGCGLLCLVFVSAARAPRQAVAFVAISPLLIGSIVLSRFDLWPTALVACAVTAFLRDRYQIGFGALGAAFAAKLFALVLLPIAIVWALRRAGSRVLVRGLATWATVVVAVFVPFAALAPHGLWRSLHEQAVRGVEIESLAGAALMTFRHPTIVVSLGATNVKGYGDAGIVSSGVEIAALLAIWVGFARGAMDDDRFVRYLAASVCAFIALGKVLSPQYLIWLVALVPLVRGLRGMLATGLLAASLIATQWYFPRHFSSVVDGRLAWFVLVRDLTLVGLLVTLSLPTVQTLQKGLATRFPVAQRPRVSRGH